MYNLNELRINLLYCFQYIVILNYGNYAKIVNNWFGVRMCVCSGVGGRGRMGVRSVCAQFPPYSITEIVLEMVTISGHVKKHEEEHSTPYCHLLYTEWLTK